MPEQVRVKLHPHAQLRMAQRGATESEVVSAVREGEQFPAKYGRVGYRRNFPYDSVWMGRPYSTKQVEAYAVLENGVWLVISVVVKFF